jgi:tRNA-Thr(GGU) m(6)t(6)A37 methyltransferase TsaA
MSISIRPVAWIRSSRSEIGDDHWGGHRAIITLDKSLPDEAFDGLEDFSHLEILFHFHKADPAKEITGKRHPRNNPNWPAVGIFARRGKNRPNHLGLTVVKLIRREGRTLEVENLDALDGTPVIDIKPMMSGFIPPEPISEPEWAREIMSRYWLRDDS